MKTVVRAVGRWCGTRESGVDNVAGKAEARIEVVSGDLHV